MMDLIQHSILNWLPPLLAIILCFIILIQDFKDREITVLVAISLGLSLFLWRLNWKSYDDILMDWIYILFFLILQFGLLFSYIQIRYGDGKNLFKKWMGLGDLLFLLCVGIAFGTFEFTFFFICSLISCILFFIISNGKAKTIPYAGIASLLIVMKVGYEFITQQEWSFVSNELFDQLI